MTNIFRNKLYKKSSLFLVLLIALCSALLIIGCPDLLDSPDLKSSDTGFFILSIGAQTQSRTIMPRTGMDNNEFALYQLIFSKTDQPDITEDRTYDKLNDPIELKSDTYTLTVYAYTSVANKNANKPAAFVELPNLEISSGKAVYKELELEPYGVGTTQGGEGIFSWDIDFPAGLTELKMEVKPISPTTGGGTYYFAGEFPLQNKKGETKLNAGYYHVVFTLEMENMRTVTWLETLHVYQNMESFYKYTFTNKHFVMEHYDVTFNYNNGDNTYNKITFFYNDHAGVAGHRASSADRRSNDFFAFQNWYTDKDCADSLGADCDVCGEVCNNIYNSSNLTEDLILYARWRISGTWTHEDGYDTNRMTSLSGSVVRGWWVLPPVPGKWVQGRVQFLGEGGGTLPMPPLRLIYTNNAAIGEAYFDQYGKLVLSSPYPGAVRIPGIQIGTTTINHSPTATTMTGPRSPWYNLPAALGGIDGGAYGDQSSTTVAQWRLRRDNTNTVGSGNIATRLYVNIPDTVDRATAATTTVQNIITNSGFNFNLINEVQYVTSLAAGRIVAWGEQEHPDYEANGTPPSWIDEIVIAPTEVERVYISPNAGTPSRYGTWTAGNFAGRLYIDVRNIPSSVTIKRWRASAENYFSLDNLTLANSGNDASNQTNRTKDSEHGIPFFVEFVENSTYTGTGVDLHSNSWVTVTTTPHSGPANPPSGPPDTTRPPAPNNNAASDFRGYSFGPIVTNNAGSGGVPTRMIRLDFDVEIKYTIIAGAPNTFGNYVFEANEGGKRYWLTNGGVPRPLDNMGENIITGFRIFDVQNATPNRDDSIQYSYVLPGRVSTNHLATAPSVFTQQINPSGLTHHWIQTAGTEADPHGPHRMGVISSVDITVLGPRDHDIVLEGIKFGTLTIELEAVDLDDGDISNIKSRVDIEILPSKAPLVESIKLVVEFNDAEVATLNLTPDGTNKWSTDVEVADVGEHLIKVDIKFK